jgi:hypothetical protein
MSAKHPSFIVRNNGHSAYFFRSIIPQDLRKYFNGTRCPCHAIMGPPKYHDIFQQEHLKANGNLAVRGLIKKNGTKFLENELLPGNTG